MQEAPMINDKTQLKSNSSIFFIMISAVIIALIISTITGRYEISLTNIYQWLYTKLYNVDLGVYTQIDTIILNIRLPRILASMLVGSSLALAGTVFQSIFRNPMVSPCLLGASHGAGFGAAIAILLALNYWVVQLSSFLFGIIAVMLTYTLSHSLSKKRDPLLMLVLSGIVVGSIFTSLISLTKYAADPEDTLPVITFWLMGNLSSVQMQDVAFLLFPIIIGMVPIIIFRNKLNILSFGDEEALSLGINVKKVRLLFIICSTIITAASVSICGIIGWVGLVIPHIARMLVGSNHNKLVPASIFLGALYLMLVDDLSRTLFSVEIPLGILTSLIGAPFFIFLLFQKKRN
jgi:iron complex transport system permease protein